MTSGSGDQRSIQTELMPRRDTENGQDFLCRSLLRRFFRLWVAILWRFRFLPQGKRYTSSSNYRWCDTGSARSMTREARPQFPGRLENRCGAFWNLNDVARFGISSYPGCPGHDLKRPKPSNFDVLAILQCRHNRVEETLHDSRRIRFRQPRGLCDLIDDIGFGHRIPFRNWSVTQRINDRPNWFGQATRIYKWRRFVNKKQLTETFRRCIGAGEAGDRCPFALTKPRVYPPLGFHLCAGPEFGGRSGPLIFDAR